MDCLKDICEMKEQLITTMKSHLNGNIESVDTKEAGEVVDMIKDLAEAEYYCQIIDAMNEPVDEQRYGYNPNRSARTGRYTRMGYTPMFDDNEEYTIETGMRRMGYPHPNSEEISRYGRAYDSYRNAKRNYTETKSPKDKQEMSSYTREHLNSTIYTLKEMWDDADPDLRKRMKSELERLVKEMTI